MFSERYSPPSYNPYVAESNEDEPEQYVSLKDEYEKQKKAQFKPKTQTMDDDDDDDTILTSAAYSSPSSSNSTIFCCWSASPTSSGDTVIVASDGDTTVCCCCPSNLCCLPCDCISSLCHAFANGCSNLFTCHHDVNVSADCCSSLDCNGCDCNCDFNCDGCDLNC